MSNGMRRWAFFASALVAFLSCQLSLPASGSGKVPISLAIKVAAPGRLLLPSASSLLATLSAGTTEVAHVSKSLVGTSVVLIGFDVYPGVSYTVSAQGLDASGSTVLFQGSTQIVGSLDPPPVTLYLLPTQIQTLQVTPSTPQLNAPSIGPNSSTTFLVDMTAASSVDIPDSPSLSLYFQNLDGSRIAKAPNGAGIYSIQASDLTAGSGQFLLTYYNAAASVATVATNATYSLIPVTLTGVNLAPTSLSLSSVAATGTLAASLLPANANPVSLTWLSSNPYVATVSAAGLVTPTAPGTTTITVQAVQGTTSMSAASVVTIVPTATGASVTSATPTLSATIGAHSYASFLVDLTPAIDVKLPVETTLLQAFQNLDGSTLSPTPSAGSYPILKADLPTGNTQFWVTYYNTSASPVTLSSNAVFNIPLTGVTLNQATLNLTKATTPTGTLVATLVPATASATNLTWSSSDPSIATVSSSGLITEVSPGTAIVTVTATQATTVFTATATITVSPSIFSVVASSGAAWTPAFSAPAGTIALAAEQSNFFALTSSGAVSMSSTGGATWSALPAAPTGSTGIAGSPTSQFVATSTSLYSFNGTGGWTSYANPPTLVIKGLTAGQPGFAVFDATGNISIAAQGGPWSALPPLIGVTSLAYQGNTLLGLVGTAIQQYNGVWMPTGMTVPAQTVAISYDSVSNVFYALIVQ